MKTERRDSWTRDPDTIDQDTPHSPAIKQSDSPPVKPADSPPPHQSLKMSDKSSSSSSKTDWNSLLKHSSAMGILKPGVVFNTYGQGSSSSSSSSSSASKYPSSYSGSTTQGSSSSRYYSSGNNPSSGSGSK